MESGYLDDFPDELVGHSFLVYNTKSLSAKGFPQDSHNQVELGPCPI